MVKIEQQLLSEKGNINYWNEFYRKVRIQEESTFCKFIKQKFGNETIIMDIGCGSGRDTFAFARDGYEVIGVDRSEQSIKVNSELGLDFKSPDTALEFRRVDISDAAELSVVIEDIKERANALNKRLVVYMRFLLHSINEPTQSILLSTLSSVCRSGDCIAAEFRTIEDQMLDKVYNDHYRRFVDSENLLEQLTHEYKFKEVYSIKGKGLSPFQNEDPYLSRIIVEKI
ncbi:class I SAM-dependent methyltransferase [Paenibacillus sp. NPDC058174]|uniref:class I SAM-dependent methyltransferase n=1 Tax=Paenibacillus sp. NPDC058174 TaxID=3346366 RepID=UPI0036DAB958